MKKILNKLKGFWAKKTPLNFKTESTTVPEAFDLPEALFESLVDELVNLIGEENRLLDFKNYIESPMFKKYQMNLKNSNHLFILGYAFSASIFIKRHIRMTQSANRAVELIYGKPPQLDS